MKKKVWFFATAALFALPLGANAGSPSGNQTDCKFGVPCYAGVTATTTGNSITTASSNMTFTVPNLSKRSAACPATDSVSLWAGNQYGANLWQAGVIMSVAYNAQCALINTTFFLFSEDFPSQPAPVQIPGVSAQAGDNVKFTIWNSAVRTAKAEFRNLTTGQTATVTRNTSYNLTNPTFLWKAETLASPPRFSFLQISAAAADQAGKVYQPGYYVNGNVVYTTMYNTNLQAQPMIPLPLNDPSISPGHFTLNSN